VDPVSSSAEANLGTAAQAEFVPFPDADVDASIPLRFQRQVVRHPDRLAIKTRTRQLSYHELEWESNRLAQAIWRRRGDGQEPIAYFLADDANNAISILGILKAGKIVVPLNVEHPASRNRLVVEDSQAAAVIIDGLTISTAQAMAGSAALINLDAIKVDGKDAPAVATLSGESFASIVYTSGSTGQPKGVLQTHRSQLHNTMHHTNSLRITPADRFCLLSSRATQQALVGIFSALLNGAGLYPFRIKEEGLERLENWIDEERVTIYHSSASIFRQFAKPLAEGRRFKTVRVVKLGSEPVGRSDFSLWKEHFSGVFVNALSSTETGTICQFVANPVTVVKGNRLPAGFAVRDMELLLLDDAGAFVKTGEVGEIAVRSKYIFSQYWRRPDETSHVLVDGPDSDGRRIFRTGDLGRLTPDGCLLHEGRSDFRVKIRGNRVEPGEIELALLDIAGVRHVVVTAFEKTPGNPSLVAYIVPEQESPPTPAFLRAELRKRLPGHMVPAFFVFLQELPLTPNGKVDRAALPIPTQDGRARPAVSTVELQVGEIWKEILGGDTVDIRQDFFEAGGDSLLAVRLLDRLEETFGKKLTPEIFLEGGTIQNLSQRLIGEWSSAPPALLPDGPDPALRPPLYFLHGDYQAGGLYTIRLARLLAGELGVYALQPMRIQGKPLPESIEAMAEEYLARLRAAQAHGPYRLGGYCHGGLVALEMAQRLVAGGERVEVVVLIDSIARNTDLHFYHGLTHFSSTIFRLTEEQRINLFLGVKRLVEQARAQRTTRRLPFVAAKLWNAAARRLPWNRKFQTKISSSATFDAELSDDERRAHFQRLVGAYFPRTYDGKIVLLASEDRLHQCQEPTLGWAHVNAKVTVGILPGNHHTCITKYLPSLAEELKHVLR
jgi:amino acid adenylation domain-containing protein